MEQSPATVLGLFTDIAALKAAESALSLAENGVELMRLENVKKVDDGEKLRREELDFGHFFGKLFGFQNEKDMEVNSKMHAIFQKNHPEKQHILVVKNPRDVNLIRGILENNGGVVEELPQVH